MPVAELKGRVSVDTSDLSRAGRAVEQFEHALQTGFRREPGRRGAMAIESAVGQLASGNLPGAIEAIATRFSGLGLAAAAGLGVAAVGIAKGVEAAHKFSEALESSEKVLNRMPAAGASMEDLAKHLEDINTQQEKLNKTSLLGQFLVRDTQRIAGVETAVRGDIAAAQRKDELAKAATETLGRELEKQKELNALGLLSAAGLKSAAEFRKNEIALGEKLAAVEAKLVDLREKAADKLLQGKALNPEAEQIEILSKLKDSLKETGDKEGKLKFVSELVERAKLSSKELASGEGSVADRLRLRQAFNAQALGDAFKRQGYVGLAAEQYKLSEQWKSGIGGLKDSEKMPEYAFKNAIDGAQVFREMVNELQNISDGVGNIDFGNQ